MCAHPVAAQNLRRLTLAENDDLRTESEIANERREGTSMNRGSASAYREAMLAGRKDEIEQLM